MLTACYRAGLQILRGACGFFQEEKAKKALQEEHEKVLGGLLDAKFSQLQAALSMNVTAGVPSQMPSSPASSWQAHGEVAGGYVGGGWHEHDDQYHPTPPPRRSSVWDAPPPAHSPHQSVDQEVMKQLLTTLDANT